MAMFEMSLAVHFVNICPPKIAGTCIALLIGIQNMSYTVIQKLTTNAVNRIFVDLTHEKLSEGNLEGEQGYFTLVKISIFMVLISLLFILLLPNQKQIDKFIEKNNQDYKEEERRYSIRQESRRASEKSDQQQ